MVRAIGSEPKRILSAGISKELTMPPGGCIIWPGAALIMITTMSEG
jgi:hypothetical protein